MLNTGRYDAGMKKMCIFATYDKKNIQERGGTSLL